MAALRYGPNMEADAEKALKVLQDGGIVIIPADVGYAVVTCDEDKLEKIFMTKGRAAHKRHAILGNWDIHNDLHIMHPQKQEILRTIVEVYGIPMGAIAKYKKDHPNLSKLSDFTLKASTVGDTVDVLVNAGAFISLLAGKVWKAGLVMMGSSANLTTTGMKYRVEDIEQPIIDIADLVIDYGLAKYHIFGRASTMLNFEGDLSVVRFGACYPTIHYIVKKHFGIELPEDPGLGELRDGHLHFPDPIDRSAVKQKQKVNGVDGLKDNAP